MKWLFLTLAVFLFTIPVWAEFTGTNKPLPAAPVVPVLLPPTVSATHPDSTHKAWLRSTDFQTFVYDTSHAKWIGETRMLMFSKTGTGVTGALNIDASVADTTSSLGDGYVLPDSSYMFSIVCANDEGIVAACSLEVFVGQTRVYAEAWTGGIEYMFPNSVIIPPSVRIAAFIKSGAQNPSRPLVNVRVRPFVSP